jgi:hypothetical protein
MGARGSFNITPAFPPVNHAISLADLRHETERRLAYAIRTFGRWTSNRRGWGIGPLKKAASSNGRLRRSQQCISPTSGAPWRYAWASWTEKQGHGHVETRMMRSIAASAGRGARRGDGAHRSSHRPGCIFEAGARGCPEAKKRISLGGSRPYPAQLQPTIL